ncbi:hypothetical protein CF70_034135 [Cupriavidus sp. SK-3]|uniref:hypothetical protein n=1 Tax=Cupriavidus sp. SK-3 TaxID=1470558 RepID=UPI0004465714|nr:hypothetical protein [Cupriavidus sp. SK-3]KDP87836.1 hypothetical protein CF70_034135 [Cupriavidus sp. SK-3]
MTHVRARNLGDDDIAEIVAILDGWAGKLSWELFIDAIERRKRTRYTRQALHRHERIKHAFSLRKTALSEGQEGGVRQVESPELQVALERIARLEGENERLAAENQRLLEQFARWAYNAHTRGLDKAFLSGALPAVNRDQTEKPIKLVKQKDR